MLDESSEMGKSDNNDDLAYTILWSPLPPITWILPFIGHVGIADSRGIASDFQGPYSVGDVGSMAFGAPTRALRIEPIDEQQWDDSITEANRVYRGRMHNLCCDNCHSHVCYALNHMSQPIPSIFEISQSRNSRRRSGGKWNMVQICFLLFLRARFLSFSGFLMQFGPFLVLVLITVLSTHSWS
jgi:transmembrane protein 222